MIFGAILAGGIGSRMNIADMPKQFLPLGDKPMIVHTIEKFLLCNEFDRIYIGVHINWVTYLEDIIVKQAGIPMGKIRIIAGGAGRNDTIMNIITAIENDCGSDDSHIIVTHDAVYNVPKGVDTSRRRDRVKSARKEETWRNSQKDYCA